MASIFSTQNLQTFLRRKYLRPASRPPPGPPGRAERRSPRSPLCIRSPPASATVCDVGLISSAMMLLKNQSLVVPQSPLARSVGNDEPPATKDGFLRAYRIGFSSSFCGRERGLAARLPNLFDLLQPLVFLVGAHGQELNDRLTHTQATLELVDQRASTFDDQQDVNTFVKSADGVSQPPLSH